MLSLQRAAPSLAAAATHSKGWYKTSSAPQRRRHAPCRVATKTAVGTAVQPDQADHHAAVGSIQLDQAYNQPAEASKQPAAATKGAFNLMSSPLFGMVPFLPVAASVAAVYAYTGVLFDGNTALQTAACGVGPICNYALVPALDALIGPRTHHATEHGANSYLSAIHVLSIVGLIAWAWSEVPSVPLQPLQFGLLAFTLGLQGTGAMVSTHELIHNRNGAMKLLGELCAAFVNFWVYSRGHMQHHQLVGTAEDHSTARKGENIWQFMGRYLAGTYTSAWDLEAAECARKGKSNLHNRVFLGVAMQAAFTAAAYAVGGQVAMGLHLTIGALTVFNMTVFDYVLHYGLTRDRAAGEPVTRALSWSSHYPLEGMMYMNAMLHGHHHVSAATAYGDLTADASEPTFPAPINAWAMLALMPPLWAKVMDPLADTANQQHKQIVASMATAGK